jgi:D-lyxose ketol-isomerase
MTKVCGHCKQEKDVTEFGSRKRSKDGLQGFCSFCSNERARRYKKGDVGKTYKLKKYGLTLLDFRNLEKEQNNVCAICGNPETKIQYGKVMPLSVDHNHNTNKVRGLLCNKCNRALGLLDIDNLNIELLVSSISYLRNNDSIQDV